VVNNIIGSPELRLCVITHVTWQWWAEADMWYGRDLVQTRSRVNVTVADQTLAVPTELTTDADLRFRSSQQHQLLLKNSSTDANNTLGLPVSNPATVNAWGMSSGSRYIYSAGSNLTPTDDFVTFGGIEPIGTISTLWFTAVRAIRLNNGNGIAVPNLGVLINKTPAFISFTAPHLPTEQAVNLWNLTVAGSVTNLVMQANGGAANFAQYFSANVGNLSLPYESEVLLVNQDTKWLGTGAVNSVNGDGALIPVPGIGRSSNYHTGHFHTNGVVFANRLALVNPPGSVDQLSFSATDPFTASPVTNDVTTITALQVWQNNLFVFTRSEVYAVTAGESFSSTSYSTERISTYGCYNQNCVTLTNLSILYLNELGVFDLLTKANTSEYGTFERSSQVRQLFTDARIRDYEQEHWIAYDEHNNKLYVGLRVTLSPNTATLPPTATKMCVLDMYWNAWATWATAGSNVYQKPFAINTHMLLWVERVLVSLEFPDHADFIQGMGGTFVTPPLEESITYLANRTFQPAINPVTPGLRQYSSVSGPLTAPGFEPPITGLEVTTRGDTLFLDTNQALTAQVWQRNALVDNLEFTDSVAPPFTGFFVNSFTAMLRYEGGTYDPAKSFALYINICRLNTNTYYTPVMHITGEPLNYYYGGVPFHSQYSSPVFNMASLGRLKRLKKLHLLFDVRNQAEFNQAYYQTPSMQQRDAALVTVTGNYNDYNTPEITSYLMRSPNDMLQLDNYQFNVEHVQQSIPLQGYGCDYQFHVASAGAEPFKLTGYEFDVTPQNSKRYVRGDN
jgi:hypothetical protein